MSEKRFNAAAEIIVPVSTPEGVKKVAVRFPTDSEWLNYRRKKKINQRDLGRRNFAVTPSAPDRTDAELIQKIKGKDSPECDAAESAYIISRLAVCTVSEQPEPEGGLFHIKARVVGNVDTEHVLRKPWMAEQFAHDGAASQVVHGPYGQQYISVNLQAPAELYDKIADSSRTRGYDGPVPIIHKAEVIAALMQEVRNDDEDGDPEI